MTCVYHGLLPCDRARVNYARVDFAYREERPWNDR
jgi:hypothetical protein